MPPPVALRAGVRLPLRLLPPGVGLAILALLAPGWSGAVVFFVAARVWRRHHAG
jgi:hypothetical protein